MRPDRKHQALPICISVDMPPFCRGLLGAQLVSLLFFELARLSCEAVRW